MTKEKILNRGLEFALEFGPNWLHPIQSHLSKKFPDLQTDELDKYDSICRTAMKDGHEFIYKTLEIAAKEKIKIKEKDLEDELNSFLNKTYPWIDSGNLKRILSQGFYYAWKDGLA
jgi:hypothetical protein